MYRIGGCDCSYSSVTDSAEIWPSLVNVSGEECWRRKLKVILSKGKVMTVSENDWYVSEDEWYDVNMVLNRQKMERPHCCRYLGVDVHETRKIKQEIVYTVREEMKVNGHNWRMYEATKGGQWNQWKVYVKQLIYQPLHMRIPELTGWRWD